MKDSVPSPRYVHTRVKSEKWAEILPQNNRGIIKMKGWHPLSNCALCSISHNVQNRNCNQQTWPPFVSGQAGWCSLHTVFRFIGILMQSLIVLSMTAQKMKFSIKDLFSKCDRICSFLGIWSHLLKKSLMKNFIFIFCAVYTKVWFLNNIE